VTFEQGSQLRTIGEDTFHRCKALISIRLLRSVTVLGPGCFNDCKSLARIDIESDSRLSTIADRAFQACSSLRSVWIPASVQTLGEFCFRTCPQLTCVQIESGSCLSHVPPTVFALCWSLDCVYLPESLLSNCQLWFRDRLAASLVTWESVSRSPITANNPRGKHTAISLSASVIDEEVARGYAQAVHDLIFGLVPA
jgi:hypothetical protein